MWEGGYGGVVGSRWQSIWASCPAKFEPAADRVVRGGSRFRMMSCVFNTLLRATPPACRFQEHWYVWRHVKYVTAVVIAEIVYRSVYAVEDNDCLRQYRLKKDVYTSGDVCSGYTDCNSARVEYYTREIHLRENWSNRNLRSLTLK